MSETTRHPDFTDTDRVNLTTAVQNTATILRKLDPESLRASVGSSPARTEAPPGPRIEYRGDTAALFAALAKAQAEFGPIVKNKTAKVYSEKGNYTFHYADLSAVLEAVRPALNKHGVFVSLPVVGDFHLGYTSQPTTLEVSVGLHLGDGAIVATGFVTVYPGTDRNGKAQGKVQDAGGARTYIARYLCSLLGIAPDEDDDANGVDGNQATVEPRQRPQQQAKPTTTPIDHKQAAGRAAAPRNAKPREEAPKTQAKPVATKPAPEPAQEPEPAPETDREPESEVEEPTQLGGTETQDILDPGRPATEQEIEELWTVCKRKRINGQAVGTIGRKLDPAFPRAMKEAGGARLRADVLREIAKLPDPDLEGRK